MAEGSSVGRSRSPALGALPFLALALPLACGRSLSSSDRGEARGGEAGEPTVTGGSAGGGRGGAVGSGGSTPTGGSAGRAGEGGAIDPECPSQTPPEAPLRRLTHFEYDTTVHDLFGADTRPSASLPAEFEPAPLAPPSAALVDGYHRVAHDIALQVTASADATSAFIGCDPADGAAACRREFLSSFLERTFRRPATAEDVEAFTTVFANGQTLGGTFQSGVRAVVEVALQSPEFLYRPELGEPAEERGAGWFRPTSYEMASRLSYLFWGSMPDEALLEAAARDELRSDEELEAQARRLLAHDHAREAVGHFYRRLFELVEPHFPASGNEQHPSFTEAIARLLPNETAAFTTDLTLSGAGDFRALLTAPYTFMNGPLADFYGVSGVSGDELQRVEWGDGRRAGVLTQAGILAVTSNGAYTNPSRRGRVVANAFLCANMPPEPPSGAELPPPPENMTTREQYELATESDGCNGCHLIINPLGFAFEHFDAAGLWRDTDNGLAIDASGELFDADPVMRFDGALELSERLAESTVAKGCFVSHWFAFAHGREATADDACSLETLERAFANGDENLRELLVALTTTDAFRYLPAVTP